MRESFSPAFCTIPPIWEDISTPGICIKLAEIVRGPGLSGVAAIGEGRRPAVVWSGLRPSGLSEENRGQERTSSAIRLAVRTGIDAPEGGRGLNPDDAFGRILALLHEATLDGARWPAASAAVDEACGTVGNALVIGGGLDDIHAIRLFYRGEARLDLAREFFEVYYPRCEVLRRHMERPDGRLIHVPELYAEADLKTSVGYNEGLRLMRTQDGLSVSFEEPDGMRVFWGVGDPAAGDGWGPSQLRLVERLVPHVRQFVRVRQALAAADALGAGLAGLLDNDRIGVVQLDRGGRVLEANAPALEILRRGDGLLDRDGALDAWLPADRSRLQRLLGRALPELWGEAPAGGSMTVQRSSGRSRLALHVSPVGDGERDFGGRRAAVLVLVVDPARRSPIDARRVAVTLGLTPSEGRMAALLAEGLRVREIAAAGGWSEDYVRWLTKQVYRKLGVSGQVELVRHVLAVDALPRR